MLAIAEKQWNKEFTFSDTAVQFTWIFDEYMINI